MLTTDGHFCGDRSGEGVRKEILLSHTSPARNPRHYAHIGRSILLASLTPHHFFTGDQGYAEAILFTEDPQVLGPARAMDHTISSLPLTAVLQLGWKLMFRAPFRCQNRLCGNPECVEEPESKRARRTGSEGLGSLGTGTGSLS